MSHILRTAAEHPHAAGAFASLVEVALIGKGTGRRYAVPSAGGLFPYAFDLRISSRSGVRTVPDLPISMLREAMAEQGTISGLSLRLTFLPGISVAKYGARGIVYGIQDCGHALANLQLAASALGLVSTIEIHPFAAVIAEATHLPERIAVVDLSFERALQGGGWAGAGGTMLLDAMRKRRSADAFGREPCPPEALRDILAGASGLLRHTFAKADPFSFHLAGRADKGEWTMAGTDTLSMPMIDARDAARVDPVLLFCDQDFTVDAGAVLIVSAPGAERCSVLDQCLSLGGIGQCLYLSAGLSRMHICCVGGFDYDIVARQFGLGNDRYAAYAMVLGVPGLGRGKVDRDANPVPRQAIVPLPAFNMDGPNAQT